jgi:hypothetical protein
LEKVQNYLDFAITWGLEFREKIKQELPAMDPKRAKCFHCETKRHSAGEAVLRVNIGW